MFDVVEFGGSGPGIVLLHGLMGRATTWWPAAQWLVRYGRVVGLDARGHGRNTHRGGVWRTEDFASDAAAVIRDLDLGPAVVIGHSMGGLHALVLAALEPSLVRGVVVEDFAPDQRGRTVDSWRGEFSSWPTSFQSLAHVRSFFGPVGDYFVECFEERPDGYHLIADLDDLYSIAAEWGRRDYWPFVSRVQAPLLVIEAEHTFMPAGQQEAMAARVPDGRHILVEGAGHLVQLSAPDVYRGAVEAFLSGLLDG
ncbi:alpha/beta fold hydrolase [Kutzneria sp. 744]|uniref:alpha/beta fold hydrolase n=1 Tax=Kutzneria sp. (strain 744) TaxID=345341 RepID=UPI0003EEC7CD|nr:alpha/beta hydrolase [Kutzneria sp. 744]EWM14495.1 alpha/beta hydrolase [Kutzneria sp. 744]